MRLSHLSHLSYTAQALPNAAFFNMQALGKSFDFSGTASRREYWLFLPCGLLLPVGGLALWSISLAIAIILIFFCLRHLIIGMFYGSVLFSHMAVPSAITTKQNHEAKP